MAGVASLRRARGTPEAQVGVDRLGASGLSPPRPAARPTASQRPPDTRRSGATRAARGDALPDAEDRTKVKMSQEILFLLIKCAGGNSSGIINIKLTCLLFGREGAAGSTEVARLALP